MTLKVPTSYRRNFHRSKGGICLRCFRKAMDGKLRCEECKKQRNGTRTARRKLARARAILA